MHGLDKPGRRQPVGQPGLHGRQWQPGETGRVNPGKLAHKGQQRQVGDALAGTQQPRVAGQLRLHGHDQGLQRAAVVLLQRVFRVTAGVFVAVQQGLENDVAQADPVAGVMHGVCVCVGVGKPAVRVALLQRPVHDVQALVDHLAAGQHQHWYGGFG